MTKQRLPILRVDPDKVAPQVLVVGDPERAADAARLMDSSVEIGYNREYRTFSGVYQGIPITVCSHGVGGPGASVCFSELFQTGVKTIIRAGTCGALRSDINDGEYILGTGAIRLDGATDALIPPAFPAVADWRVVGALCDAAQVNGVKYPHLGIVLTQSFLYPMVLPSQIDLWMKAGAVCVEMELATLLVMASLSGARASILRI